MMTELKYRLTAQLHAMRGIGPQILHTEIFLPNPPIGPLESLDVHLMVDAYDIEVSLQV